MLEFRRWVACMMLLALAACAAPQGATRTEASGRQDASGRAGTKPESGGAQPESQGPVPDAIRRSMTYLAQGKADAAQALLEQTVAGHADAGRLHNALGVVYKSQGKFDEAKQAYQKAIELRDGHIEAYYNLAILYREQGLFKEAEKEYRHALFLKPDFAQAHYNLGVLYDLYLDQPENALEHYKEYKKAGGTDEDVNIWIKDLERRTGKGASKPPPVSVMEERS